jgi:hypothetical protein
LIAAWMSRAAPSTSRSRSNCTVTPVVPSELCDVISLTPAIRPNRRSSGIATAVAIVVGLAPGSDALTLMVGKSTLGSGDTGSWVNAAAPASSSAAASNHVAFGRRMNGADRFMAPAPRPPAARPPAACGTGARCAP